MPPLLTAHGLPPADSDIVFLAKPVWPSYLAFINEGGADAAFQTEGAIFNGGNYVVLPSANSIAFARTWTAMAPRMLRERNHDQDALAYMGGSAWAACTTLGECRRARANVSWQRLAGPGALQVLLVASGGWLGKLLLSARPCSLHLNACADHEERCGRRPDSDPHFSPQLFWLCGQLLWAERWRRVPPYRFLRCGR